MASFWYVSKASLIFFLLLLACVRNVFSQREVLRARTPAHAPGPRRAPVGAPGSRRAPRAAPGHAPGPMRGRNVSSPAGVSNIMTFGAKADGRTDSSKAMLAAWAKVCASTTRSTLLIPKGIFLLSVPIKFNGPCKNPVGFQLDGTVKAPPQMKDCDEWIEFMGITGLTVTGTGAVDGQGQAAWKVNSCAKKESEKCKYPMNLRFSKITGGTIRDITSINSKLFHIGIRDCTNMKLLGVKISAPGTSINTDGIHIATSKGVEILGGSIATGDDCVSFKDGCDHVHVRDIHCGPGHGFSIGSLGKSKKNEVVTGVHIQNCTITGTDNGVRIKSWPGGISGGTVTNTTFEDITLTNVQNPISINQEYCPYRDCNRAVPSKIKITGVKFKNIHGTSATKECINLLCSRSNPCTGVELANINIKFRGGPGISTCKNCKPIIGPSVSPPACAVHPPAL